MAALNILYNKAAQEIRDSVRRLINDVDLDRVSIPDHVLVEMSIAEFILASHELGADPRIPTRSSTGASLLSYTLDPGVTRTTIEGESDVAAVDTVTCDRTRVPLEFVPRAQLENWINTDVKLNGAVQRGIPAYWTMRIEQRNAATNQAEMSHSMLVYPAPDQSTVIYWPRTLVDTENVDPSSTTGRMATSYLVTFGLEYRLAAMCIRMMDEAGLKRCGVTRELADQFWQMHLSAFANEKRERSMHWLSDAVQQGQP